MHDPAVMAFQDKVTTERDDIRVARMPTEVTHRAEGWPHATSCRIDHCIGSASNPMTDEQFGAEVRDLASQWSAHNGARCCVERAWAAESLADIGELARAAA